MHKLIKSVFFSPLLTISFLHSSIPHMDSDRLISAYYENGSVVQTPPEPQMTSSEKAPSSNIFSYRPAIERTGFIFGSELLYWKLDEAGMDYAFQNNKPPAFRKGSDVESIVGNLLRVDFDWSPGVRIWGGYCIPDRYWEVEGDYTFYYTSSSKSTHIGTGANASLVVTFAEFIGGEMEKVQSDFHLHYHTARLHIARQFLVGDTIFLRFVSGLKGAWIDQKWSVTYRGTNLVKSTHNNDWDYQAGGLHIGMDSDWYLGYGVSLFFNGDLAALYGTHKTSSSTKLSDNTGGPFQDFSPKDHRVVQTMQILGGIAWGKVFNYFTMRVFAAYEINVLFNIQEQYRLHLAGNSAAPLNPKVRILTTSPVNLQGLTMGFLVEF